MIQILSFYAIPKQWFLPYILVRPDYTLCPTPFGTVKFLVPGAVPFAALLLVQLTALYLAFKACQWAQRRCTRSKQATAKTDTKTAAAPAETAETVPRATAKAKAKSGRKTRKARSPAPPTTQAWRRCCQGKRHIAAAAQGLATRRASSQPRV